jgi:hypothetical protein
MECGGMTPLWSRRGSAEGAGWVFLRRERRGAWIESGVMPPQSQVQVRSFAWL